MVVMDPQALWHAGAHVAFRQPDISITDVEDVLGPLEDPMIIDCLAMLTAPAEIAGCMSIGFSVEPFTNRQLAHFQARTMMETLPMSKLIG